MQAAEDAWNSRDPERVALAYTPDSEWRNRDQFFSERDHSEFPARQVGKGAGLSVEKTLWAFTDNRIAVRFEYEWHDYTGQWFRSYGNEMWEFTENGLMQKRYASINDVKIAADERRVL